MVIYYQQSGEECHISYVIISDCMHHDTIALYLFQKNLITFLKQVLHTGPKKIIYFSDGAASQYKNRKNFVNLCNHETDFGVKAEWHFSATSHGKGACDGVGGTVKHLASRASLQRPYDQQIMTPHQLFEWASNNIQGIVFQYCSCSEYEEVKNLAFRHPAPYQERANFTLLFLYHKKVFKYDHFQEQQPSKQKR